MNWKAANDKQQEALWRIFLMFVAMAVLVIRTGLVSRGVIAVLSVPDAEQDDMLVVEDPPEQPLTPDDLREITLILLCLAEAAGQMLIGKERTVWELMNRPLPQTPRAPRKPRQPVRAPQQAPRHLLTATPGQGGFTRLFGIWRDCNLADIGQVCCGNVN
jgi:hypothetical protein